MDRVLHDLLLHSTKKYPHKTLAFHKDKKISYNEVNSLSQTLASYLNAHSVNKGDRVAFYLEKRFEKIISIFGISFSGGIFVPISRLALPHQVVHILKNSGSKILITTYDRFRILYKDLKDLKHLVRIITVEYPESGELLKSQSYHLVSWEKVLKGTKSSALPYVVENDISCILYTSGSTGRPKGVVISHHNVVTGAYSVSEYLRMTESDRLLSILPFNFDYGLNQLTSAVLHGAQIVLLDSLFPREILNAIEKYKITGLAAVAATWIQLLQITWDIKKLKSLRYITNSGGAIPEEHVKELRKRIPWVSIYLMYGLTEAFRSTYLDPELVDERPTSMGKAIPGEEIIIVDENNNPVKPDEIGELVHRGPLVAQGYWDDPELTKIRFRISPFLNEKIPITETVVYSGDLVQIDVEGFLYFKGRKDDIIKCAGHRVSPTEIEEIIHLHKEIQDVVAFGVPHEIYGQAVYVVALLKDNKEISKEDLMSHCKKMLPPHMQPIDIEFFRDFPRLVNGKIDRSQIKKSVLNKFNQT